MSPLHPFATIEHDLRGPLSVIAGTASALRATAPPDEHAALDKIISEAWRLDRMLENRVVAARLVDGHVPRREWVPLEELVGNTLARAGTLADGPHLALAIEPGALAHVEGRLCELVLANLIDNAIRHARGIRMIRGHADATRATFEVDDLGPGFDPPPIRPGAVTGLGVVRAIAAAHGGTFMLIARESGTTARVDLPHAAVRPTFGPGAEE